MKNHLLRCSDTIYLFFTISSQCKGSCDIIRGNIYMRPITLCASICNQILVLTYDTDQLINHPFNIPTIQYTLINIQYWYIDSKYIIYVARLRNGGKTSFQRVFPTVSCRATYILYLLSIHQCCIYPAIKMLLNLIINKKR